MARALPTGSPDIAIVGMACRFPGAPDVSRYWRLIREGRNAFGPPPADRWSHEAFYSTQHRAMDRYYAPAGAFIEDIKSFAAMEFGIPPRRVEVMDPQQRMSLETAWYALQDAGYAASIDNAEHGRPINRRRIGTFLGLCGSEFRLLLSSRVTAQMMAAGDLGEGATDEAEAGRLGAHVDRVVPSRAFSAPGVLGNMSAAAIAQELDLGGPAFTVDAACASALVAVHDAITYLRAGQIDAALAGGAYLNLTPENLIAFSRIGAISAKGVCRPFDADADGFVQGEGVGFVLLRRLDDALRDRDRIYAIVRGSGCNNDGRGDGPMSPRREGQEAVIADAWKDAGISANDIGYIETHGTGTSVGDRTELTALRASLGPREIPIPLGSAKANIGHTMSAAGIAGLIKTALAVHHAVIPPLANWAAPHPDHELDDGTFTIPTASTPWIGRRVALVSSFGFGGTNAHLVLEGAPPAARTRLFPASAPMLDLPGSLVVLSADTAPLLAAHLADLAATLHDGGDLSAVVHTLNLGRRRRGVRVAIVATTLDELRSRLQRAADVLAADPATRGALDRDSYVGDAAEALPVAFLAPGQGMQKVGMMRDWLRIPDFAASMSAMEAAVADITPRPLLSYIYGDGASEDALTDTKIAQPAMLAIGISVATVLHRFGVDPAIILGHSLGEFTATALSGAVEAQAALRFVALRGRAMAQMPGDHGAMAAIMASAEDVAAHLAPGAVLANHNHPRQNVISGPTAAVEASLRRLAAAGLKARRIPVSHAFHSPLLEAVQPDVERGVEEMVFSAPTVPMASCIAEHRPFTADAVRAIYRRHATSPVEYVRGLNQCQQAGARIFIQLAGGATLCAFARGSVPEADAIVSVAADDEDKGLGLLRVLALCAANGHRIDLTAFGDGLATLPPTPLPTQVYWPVQTTTQMAAPIHVAKARDAGPKLEAHELPGAPSATDSTDGETVADRVMRVVSKVSAFPLEALRSDQKLLDDLGFDSLMASELGTRLAEIFPGFTGIPRSLLASSPTVADLVRHVEGASAEDAVALTSPDRALVAYIPTLVEHRLSGLLRRPGRVLIRPTLTELRSLPPGDLVVVSEVLGSDPVAAGVTGFVKALAREWPDHKVCVVDGSAADATGESSAAERDVEVVYRDGVRHLVGLVEAPVATRVSHGQKILITGGTGWLGRLIARTLVAEGATVILMGTRADPGDALAELGAAGRYVRADVRRELPALDIDGIIHAAGVLADGPVGTADPETAWSIKVDGLANLHQHFPNAWIVAIGSYAARFGNAWQTEYAAANEAMAALARRIGASTQVWGPWSDSEMVATIPLVMRRTMREDGVWFVDTAQGTAAFLANLGGTGERVLGLDLPRLRPVLEVEEALDPGQNWLRDHALMGRPTVPMAMVIEWAAALVGGAAEIADLTLYDGVVVDKPVTVRRRLDGERFTVWSSGRLAWKGTVRQHTGALRSPVVPGGAVPTLPLPEFYAKHTFHGPTLRGIESVDRLGDHHVSGIVRVGRAEDWGQSDWSIGPLAVDSALQLSAYWAHLKLGRAGFPVRVAKWTQVPTRARELHATLSFETQKGDRFTGRVVLTTPDGQVIAIGEGVEAELRGGDEIKVAPEHTDFGQFPAFLDLQQRLQAAKFLGINNPYFKVLDGVARDTITIEGRPLIHFSGYNYLGFSGHPYVTRRVEEAVERYGTSVSASRVASGERPIHLELEAKLAAALGVDDAVVFTAGHATNVTVIGHLFGAKDLILHDELIHDSALQGMKLSGATRRPFAHGDMGALARMLETMRPRFEKCLLIIEGVYSMDGDMCDLPMAVQLKKRHRAFLMVDEAHSFGVVGTRGYGVSEHFGVDGRDIDIWMGTLSKTLSSCGGYLAGSRELVQLLKYTAPGFVYSAGLTPANTMASIAALELMEREPEHVARLQSNARYFYDQCQAAGLDTGPSAGESAVVPIIVGNSFHALLLSDALFQRGINVQPILYPAVADNGSRLRFFLSSTHTEEQLRQTVSTVREELERIRAAAA